MVELDAFDRRLGRIEQDLRSITDALIKLATVEERMSSQTSRLDGHDRNIDDHELRLRTLESDRHKGRGAMSVWERLGWIAATGAAALIPNWLK